MARLKFIPPLAEEAREQLREVYTSHPDPKLRRRVHAVLLSDQGHTLNQLQDMLQADRDTISIWFRRFEAQGVEGLVDLPRPGRPKIYTAAEIEAFRALVEAEPRQIRQAQAVLEAQTGKASCTGTLRCILKN